MNKKTLVRISIILALVLGGVSAGSVYYRQHTVSYGKKYTDISYSSVSKNNILDIYIPTVQKETYPVIVWIHGGAFKFGSKSDPQYLQTFLDDGIAVVSVNYRLSSEAIWPAQLEDMQAIIRFIKTNAATYHLNPNAIITFGASAGGYLSSIVGTALADDPSTKVLASIDWFGPVDFFTMDADIQTTGVTRKTGNNGDADSPESALLGVTVKENQAKAYAASPLSYIERASTVASFLIMHGGADQMIGAPQSVRLHTALVKKFGTEKAEYHFLPNGTHGGGDFETEETKKIVMNFVQKQFAAYR